MRLIPSKSRLFPFLPITPNVSLDSYICSPISPLLIIVHVSMSYYITRSPESTMEFCVFITFTSVCQFVWDPIHLHTMHSRCLVITPKIWISRIYHNQRIRKRHLCKECWSNKANSNKNLGQSSCLPTEVNDEYNVCLAIAWYDTWYPGSFPCTERESNPEAVPCNFMIYTKCR